MTLTATPAPTTTRAATPAMAGGALWLLLPAAWAVGEAEPQPYGSLGFVAVTASYWICLVLAPALLAAAAVRVRAALGQGRLPAVGTIVAAIGLGAMAVGNGIEVASISAGGEEVALGHAIFFAGFLTAVVGGVLVGIAVVRRRRDALSRAAGWLLILALPLGIGIGALGSMVAPENDAAFWAAISVPTGLGWLLLGLSLTRSRAAAR